MNAFGAGEQSILDILDPVDLSLDVVPEFAGLGYRYLFTDQLWSLEAHLRRLSATNAQLDALDRHILIVPSVNDVFGDVSGYYGPEILSLYYARLSSLKRRFSDKLLICSPPFLFAQGRGVPPAPPVESNGDVVVKSDAGLLMDFDRFANAAPTTRADPIEVPESLDPFRFADPGRPRATRTPRQSGGATPRPGLGRDQVEALFYRMIRSDQVLWDYAEYNGVIDLTMPVGIAIRAISTLSGCSLGEANARLVLMSPRYIKIYADVITGLRRVRINRHVYKSRMRDFEQRIRGRSDA